MTRHDAVYGPPGINGYFRMQRYCFACIGVNPTSLECTFFSYFMTWLPLISLMTLCFPVLNYAIKNIEDIDKVTDSLSPFWQSIMAIFKLIYFMWNSKKIVKLIRKLWLWNLEAVDKELAILSTENRKDIMFCTFYHACVASTGCLALVAPFIIAGFYGFQGENFWEYLEPPLRADYVIAKQSHFGYTIVYIWNMTAIYLIIYGSVSIDSLFSWFMCNIVAQFRILKYRLRCAGVSKKNNGNCSAKIIRDCIAYHRRTIQLANDFNNVYCVVVFIKFTISCIQICCLAFQFSRGGKLVDQVYRGLFLLSVTMQLMLYCYGGQKIQDESDSVAGEIYKSFRWDTLTFSNRKILIFAIMRSQVPCHVSGIFFTANLSLFLWVYRTAASFITMLWTLEEKKDYLK